MLGLNSIRVAANLLAGSDLMHIIRMGQFVIDVASAMSFADEFYALAGQIPPA
jgi:putative transposase